MWKIVDNFATGNLRWPESGRDLVFPTKEMAQTFIELNLDEENCYHPWSDKNHELQGLMQPPKPCFRNA